MHLKRLLSLGFVTILQACASGSEPVPLSVAIRVIERDLRDAGAIPLSELNASDRARASAVDTEIFHYQCYYNSANPVIPVLTNQFTLGLQGTFRQGVQLGVGGGGGTPTGDLQYNVSSERQQTLTIPMALVPVSDLPALHLRQSLAYLTDLRDAEKKAQVAAVFKTESELTNRLASIIAAFPSRRSQCPKNPLPP
jgi:hypothetical protein